MSAGRTIREVFAFLLLLICGSAGGAEPGRSVPAVSKAVLVLSSERSALPAVLNFQRGLREKLPHPDRTQFFVEYLDFGRFPERTHEAAFVRYLRERYAGRRIDVIVPFLDDALQFLLAHREELFPGVPVVAAGMERRHVEGPRLPPGIIAIPTVHDYDRTLDLALKLQPDAREVLVVHGVAPYDLRRREDVRRSLERGATRLRYRMLGGVPLSEIENAVRNLPPQSFVLFASLARDAEDRPLTGLDYASRLAAVSSVPVYGIYGTHIARGLVGGAVTDFATIGRATSAVVAQVLAGKPPETIALETPETPLHVNWRAIEKWRIPPQRIPLEAQILFREPGLWDEYRGTVLGTLAALLLQAALIAGLILQLSRRRRAESARKQADEALRRKQHELEHIARVSAMGEIAASLAHELNQPLAAILSNAQAGLRLLDRPGTDQAEIREILQDVVADDKRAGNVIGTLRTMLRRGTTAPRKMDLADTVRNVLRLLDNELVEQHVEVETVLPAGSFVLADKTQAEQVLLNLVMNGVDAMRQRPARERRLRIALSRAGETAAQIAIRDSGMGISDDDLEKVFDAFWTTKTLGMGMGLAVCKSIVDSYGCRIWVEPNHDQGVTFFFTLPLAQ